MTPTLDPFSRRARLVSVPDGKNIHDADTVKLETDSGYGGREESDLRLAACYMPELDELGGPDMRLYVVDWFVASDHTLTWPFWVSSEKTKVREPGQRTTLSRYLSTVWRFDGKRTVGPSLNDELCAYLAQHPEWGHGKGQPK